MKQLIRSAAVTERGGTPPSRGETTFFKADEDHVVQSKANKQLTPPPPSSVGMHMESLSSERWKHSGADQSPNISAAQYCLEGFPSTQDAIYNSVDTPPPPQPRFRDSFNWIKEGLPQNFVPAVTAPVPLTAVQVTDANLLKSKKRSG